MAGLAFTWWKPASAAQMTRKFALFNKNASIVGVMAMSQIGKKMTKDKKMRATVDLEFMPDHVDTYEDAACYLLMEMHKQNHALSRIMASLCDTGPNPDDEVMEWFSKVSADKDNAEIFVQALGSNAPVKEKNYCCAFFLVQSSPDVQIKNFASHGALECFCVFCFFQF